MRATQTADRDTQQTQFDSLFWDVCANVTWVAHIPVGHDNGA
jgi:hypothetical protein